MVGRNGCAMSRCSRHHGWLEQRRQHLGSPAPQRLQQQKRCPWRRSGSSSGRCTLQYGKILAVCMLMAQVTHLPPWQARRERVGTAAQSASSGPPKVGPEALHVGSQSPSPSVMWTRFCSVCAPSVPVPTKQIEHVRASDSTSEK